MTARQITRRHALATGAAGAAVLLAGGVGAAAAAGTKPKRRPSGAWYVREYEQIGVYPTCGVYPAGTPNKLWLQLGTSDDVGLRSGSRDRYDEINELYWEDPTAKQKIMRHCVKTGRYFTLGWRGQS